MIPTEFVKYCPNCEQAVVVNGEQLGFHLYGFCVMRKGERRGA